MELASSGSTFHLRALVAMLLILVVATMVIAAEPIEVDSEAVVDCGFDDGYAPVDVAVRRDGVMFVGTVPVAERTIGLIYRIEHEGSCEAVGVAYFGLDVDEFGAPCGVTYRSYTRGPVPLFTPPMDVACFPQPDSWEPRALRYRDWWGERIFIVDERSSAWSRGLHSFGFHYVAGTYWKGVWVRSSSNRESDFSSAHLVGIRQLEGEEYVVEELMQRIAPGEVVARIVMTPWAPYFINSLDDETLVVSGLKRPQIPIGYSHDGRMLPLDGPGALLLVSADGDIKVLSEDFVYPSGVLAIDDVIFVADQATGEIHRHTLSGERIGTVSGLNQPMGLALAPDGNICVAEAGAARVICLPQSAFGATRE